MRVLGIDPGGTGALALLDARGLDLRVEDMPVHRVSRGSGTKAELDVHAFERLVCSMAPDACYFERVHGQDGDGVSAAFNFGEITGAARALCVAHGSRFIRIAPYKWKKEMGLVGKAKDDGRAMATELWPSMAEAFARKKDDGRADAALIAEYGRRDLVRLGVLG